MADLGCGVGADTIALAETGPAALVAFALNGIVAVLTALSFAEMSSMFPESGGAYTFAKKVLTVRAAFGVGWVLWFAYIVAGVLYAQRVIGQEVVFTGEDLPTDENVLVVSNHQQMPDITTIMTLARSKGRLGDLKFFVKHALKWVPGVGWGMQFINCPFLKRDWSADRDKIDATFATLVNERIPMWLVSFVEGTRATEAKIKASAE